MLHIAILLYKCRRYILNKYKNSLADLAYLKYVYLWFLYFRALANHLGTSLSKLLAIFLVVPPEIPLEVQPGIRLRVPPRISLAVPREFLKQFNRELL